MASMIIADGCPVFLCGLISVLRSVQDFDVVASCCNPTESLQMIRDLSPDIALLDSSMPIALGINVLASAVSEGSQTRIVLLAVPEELQSVFAIPSGAYGTIPRDVLPEVLIHDLRQVAAGRRLSMRASEPREARTAADTSEKALTLLTKRERQIATLVSAGLPNKEIGRQLNLTAGTIKVHLHNIYQKLLHIPDIVSGTVISNLSRGAPRAERVIRPPSTPHMSLRLFACLRGQSAVTSLDQSNSFASIP
jgi:two-component system, NarL family, nitrate/nitrite response regulator NarL